VEVKRQFYRSLGVDKYYVLNEDLISQDHSCLEFETFLEKLSMSSKDIDSILESMRDYSGQYTKRPITQGCKNVAVGIGFVSIFEHCLQPFQLYTGVEYLGIKETMCEEFLPYFCRNGYQCIVIIRDPRDVLASANYPKTEKHFGNKRPSLFILRTWRKSVEFAHLLRGNPNFHFLRYEDLVASPYPELHQITSFLALDNFGENFFDEGIRDRDGNVWLANSSFEHNRSFISQESVGIHKSCLSVAEKIYVEAVCKHEMNWLGYERDDSIDPVRSIKEFRDEDIEFDQHMPAEFSSLPDNVSDEIDKLNSPSQFQKHSHVS
jgi:hypothetical protein